MFHSTQDDFGSNVFYLESCTKSMKDKQYLSFYVKKKTKKKIQNADLDFVIMRKVTVCRSSSHTYTSLKYIHTNIITLRFDWYTKLSQESVIILKVFACKRLYVVHVQ